MALLPLSLLFPGFSFFLSSQKSSHTHLNRDNWRFPQTWSSALTASTSSWFILFLHADNVVEDTCSVCVLLHGTTENIGRNLPEFLKWYICFRKQLQVLLESRLTMGRNKRRLWHDTCMRKWDAYNWCHNFDFLSYCFDLSWELFFLLAEKGFRSERW